MFFSISFSSLIQFHLPLFMINKVNVALLRQFLVMYCLSKLIIRLTHDVFSISFSSLIQFHLPLFMINKVNVALLRQFLVMYCLSKHHVLSIKMSSAGKSRLSKKVSTPTTSRSTSSSKSAKKKSTHT